MIVTDHFVYIHVSRSGGTFLNKLIMEQVPGARMIQYHGHLEDLPEQFAHLPVIGFSRNPWDWYVSMYCDYKRKRQYVFQALSEMGTLGFEQTIERFLTLGDNSDESRERLKRLVRAAPRVINTRRPGQRELPGLKSEHFADYPSDIGYYSWLFQLMFRSERKHRFYFGQFEQLREEALRLFEETGTPITNGINKYLTDARPLNSSPRPKGYEGGYPPKLESLVAEKERYMIDRFGYSFTEVFDSPKTDDFNYLGSTNVDALINRVCDIPESEWDAADGEKPNKIKRLNDTRHIIFRFITDKNNVFEFSDHPTLWDDWKDLLLPVMTQAAKSLGYKNYRFPRVMFARLPAGGEISDHSDGQASYFIHKIHVPLVTNERTMFRVGTQEIHMPVGEIIEVNNKRNHAVRNDGDKDRIHLIFECYNVDDYGKS